MFYGVSLFISLSLSFFGSTLVLALHYGLELLWQCKGAVSICFLFESARAV